MKVAYDGYVLRFQRTGIVNYGFAVARGYRERLTDDAFRILVGDSNVTAEEIREFLAIGDVVSVFDQSKESVFEKLRRKLSGNVFSNFLPGISSAVNDATRGFDVYHCTDWLFERSRHVRLNVITVFDLTTTLFPQFHEELNITKERMKLQRLVDYDFVFCISAATREDLIRHVAVDPERVIVNHIDTDPIFDFASFSSREAVTSKYGVPEGYLYLLSVSTIEPRKNFIGVLDAFREFVRANPDAPYVLVCTGMWGWRNGELNDYLRRCGFADRVIFTGFVDLADLPSLYRHAECFIYLSFYEGFGLPILEAMKSNCPVICSNTSSMPEVIGEAGIQVAPTDVDLTARAIAKVVGDSSISNGMRAVGLERSKIFSWNKHLDLLLQTYEKVL